MSEAALEAGDEHELVARAFVLDPDRSNINLYVGGKGSGKSEAARQLYRSWPYDKLAIDITRDAEPGEDAQVLKAPYPPALPESVDSERPFVNVHMIVDPRSPTYKDDLDRGVGYALFPRRRRVLFWADEWGRHVDQWKTPPNAETFLMSSRHHNASGLLCCPRPVKIDPLSRAQADRIFLFDGLSDDDRNAIADDIGWKRAALEREYAETHRRGRHWYLLYVRELKKMFRCAPLPIGRPSGPKA